MDKASQTSSGGSPLLSLAFLLLGLLALVLTVTGNLWFGKSLAQSEEAQYWQGGSAVYIDIMVAALAGACGWLFSNRRWIASICVGALAITFAAMSALSLVGLGAMERVAKARGIEVANVTAKESASDRNVFAAGAHERNLSWLRKEAANPRLTRAERAELRKELREEAKAGPALTEARIAAPMADPQAEFIAELSGLPVDKIQVFFVAALAILLIVGKTVSFWLSGYFSRGQIVSEQTLSIPLATQTPVLSNSQSNIKELEDARAASTPVENSGDDNASQDDVEDYSKSSTLSLLNPPLSSSSDDHDNEVRRLGAAVRQTVNRHVFDETILAQFLAERTMIRNGHRVSAHNLYAAYLMYAQRNNYSVLSQNQFGRLATAAGLQRISSRRGMDYLDLVLLDETGSGEVAQAAAA